MENVHSAIAWYQTKIGSYDKQLWEQSVERKLQKQPPFVLHNAPRKKVRLKTEYIDVDLIRGSTFAKTKPQVPWVYITRKAVARVLLFPFYYTWWVHQTSKRLYGLLLMLYVLQVTTVIVYVRNYDQGIMADELCFTEVTLPVILMFLLCLIHSQTVLAHITHKPPKRNKNISEVTRKPRPKKASRRGKSSGNNSTCPEDGGNTDTSRTFRRRSQNQPSTDANFESYPVDPTTDGVSTNNIDPQISPSIDMEKNLMSRSLSDYELKPAISSPPNKFLNSVCSSLHNKYRIPNDVQLTSDWNQDTDPSCVQQNDEEDGNVYCVLEKLEHQKDNSEKINVYSNTLQNGLPSNVTVKKVDSNTLHQRDLEDSNITNKPRDKYCKCCSAVKVSHVNLLSHYKLRHSVSDADQHCFKVMAENCRNVVTEAVTPSCVNTDRGSDTPHVSSVTKREDTPHVSSVTKREDTPSLAVSDSAIERHKCEISSKACPPSRTKASRSADLGLDVCVIKPTIVCNIKPIIACSGVVTNVQEPSLQDVVHLKSPCDSNNLGMSDFELVDHYVVHEDNSPEHGSSRKESATCSSSVQVWKNYHNSLEEQSQNGQTHDSDNSVRSKPKPFKSQDSSDSGINNEAPFVDCSCLSTHKDSLCDCVAHSKWHNTSTGGVDDSNDTSTSGAICHRSHCGHQTKTIEQSYSDDSSLLLDHKASPASSLSLDSYDPLTVKVNYLPNSSDLSTSQLSETNDKVDHRSGLEFKELKSHSPTSCNHSIIRNETPSTTRDKVSQTLLSQHHTQPASESSSQLRCFSEQFVQEILNEDTLREMSCTSLLAHSDLEHSSSSSVSRLSTASSNSSASNSSSSCCKISNTDHIPSYSNPSSEKIDESTDHHRHNHHHSLHQNLHKQQLEHTSPELRNHDRLRSNDDDDEKTDLLDESLEHIHASDGERPSDDISNYNPSDSDADSDGPVSVDICNTYEEKWKRLRFQDHADTGKIVTSKGNTNITSGAATTKAGCPGAVNGGGGSRSVVGILTRKPSPLKDLAIVRKANGNIAVTNSSGSDQAVDEIRGLLRRRRRTSGTTPEPAEPVRARNVPTALGLLAAETKGTHLSSSENETGGARTPEGSNKATMSSEEWEDRMQSDETTSSAYSSNSEVDSEEREDGEEKTEYTTSTLHVINLLQPQSGSPSSSGNIVQPDKVSCVIWEGNDCKKVDLTALDIGWAIIDKVDSLPESSDYFLIGLSFSFVICVVPLVFRAYASKDVASLEDFLSWSGLMTKLVELSVLIRNSYSWRQYFLMANGILQRFFLSLIFFFLLSVADRTFKQRLLYAKHFSYLTSSRRARKFSMPHFRLNKVRNIKIWLSLRSYLKRRGPQRSVDVIVSACFLCAVCTVCLISLQMLKDTDSFLDYLCNWELLVWCTALGVFLMRFMTVGLKINKKYRNLSVLITEQINLYLQMEQKPHKKEELILANNVLRLAEDLLKELESPFKISGFSANPLIYNIMRVVVLSAFSAVLTEVLGFKLKLHKIKLKA